MNANCGWACGKNKRPVTVLFRQDKSFHREVFKWLSKVITRQFFQPMRSTTKTNRALNAWFFPRFEKVPDTRTPSLAASIKRFHKIRIQFSLYLYRQPFQTVSHLTCFKVVSSWCRMGSLSYSFADEMISIKPRSLVFAFKDTLKSSTQFNEKQKSC